MLSNSEVFLGNVLTKIGFFKNIWRLIDREAGFISAHFFLFDSLCCFAKNTRANKTRCLLRLT